MVTLQKSYLGSGPRFSVADPGVRYQGPLRSPILTVQALAFTPEIFFLPEMAFSARNSFLAEIAIHQKMLFGQK